MAMRVEKIGRAKLFLGDCAEVMQEIEGADALVTDPPYGLGGRLHKAPDDVWHLRSEADLSWDDKTAPKNLSLALRLCHDAIVWGGNYYALPIARCWLLWDKMQEHSGAHAEMAWTNLDKPVRTFRYARAQLASEGKIHPTQKPLRLMKWCLEFIPNAQSIFDPFMGSGTTGVAAVEMGRDFIGVEREERYFDMACRRIEQAQRQQDLFISGAAA